MAGSESEVKPLERWLGFGVIVAQLALLVAVATRYRFESPGFQNSLPWIAGAFVVHHLLPARVRMHFFVVVSMATIAFVLGARPSGFDFASAFQNGGALLAIGVGLIAICHLPVAFAARVALLGLVGVILIATRGGFLAEGALPAVWPILGALFMFRLIVYVYDMQSAKERPPLVRSLAYFFMLPNAFFPLFPVVDWKKFSAGYASDAPLQLYQHGLHSMARGLLHIVMYRVVYYHFYIDSSQIADGESLLRFVLANFALYLRVSGQFHMIVGLLQLFGFNLPATNHHYFLADSFTDYWRRVNIYWKDFMVKIFYTPVAFRLRGRGVVLPVVAGSAAAFLATWLLHAYQSYWLRGAVFFSLQDGLFWLILGVLVMANAAWEAKHPRRRSLSKKIDWRATGMAALRTTGVFSVLAALWSLWSAKSVGEWLAMWAYVDADFVTGLVVTLAIVAACKVGVEVLEKGGRGDFLFGKLPRGARLGQVLPIAAATVVLPLAAVFLLGDARVLRRVDGKTRFVIKSLKSNQPNTADLRKMERGYYENLFDAANSNFVDSGAQAPADWIDFPEIEILKQTGDMRFWNFAPSRAEVINGYTFSTNALGLRDQEYPREKAPDRYRVAVLGSSHVMGWGINDDETFESLAEASLATARPDGRRLEILNFGVGGYSPVCQLGVMREGVLPLLPDAIYFVAHGVDGALAIERLARLVHQDIALEDEFLRDIVARAGIKRSMSQLAMQRELPPFAKELVAESYRVVGDLARDAGALPVWIYLPRITEQDANREAIDELRGMADRAGFITFDMSGLWDEMAVDDLAIAPWDMHPNAEGHRMIAERLEEIMQSDPRLGFSPQEQQ